MGVFSNIVNVEELKGWFDKVGIFVYIEVWVQVGLFRNKVEVEVVQKKLFEMGLFGLLFLLWKQNGCNIRCCVVWYGKEY